MSLYGTPADSIPAVSWTDKCIVLDIDLTLVETQKDGLGWKTIGLMTDPKLIPLRSRAYYLGSVGPGGYYDFWGVTRPNLHEFLVFCFSYFKLVTVWSAGKKDYVLSICDSLFRGIRSPHLIYTQDDCVRDAEGQFYKPLQKMIDDPRTMGLMNFKNTWVLDDNPDTLIANPTNGIVIPPYETHLNTTSMMMPDPTLLNLKTWLLRRDIAFAPDVRVIPTGLIFTQPLASPAPPTQPLPLIQPIQQFQPLPPIQLTQQFQTLPPLQPTQQFVRQPQQFQPLQPTQYPQQFQQPLQQFRPQQFILVS